MRALLVMTLAFAGFYAESLWRGISAREKTQRAEASLDEAVTRIHHLEESTKNLTQERNTARASLENSTNQLASLQKQLQENKEQLKDAKAAALKIGIGTEKVSGSSVKARAKIPTIYPAPELETFRKKELEWMRRKFKSESIRSAYDKLTLQLNLNETDREYFLALMEKRQEVQLSSMPPEDLASLSGDPEKIKTAIKKQEVELAAVDQDIETFLNDATDYRTYRNWERTKSERGILNLQKWAFESYGEPLSAEQEERLVEVMHASTAQALQDKVIAPNAGLKLDPGTSELNPKQLDAIKASMATLAERKDQLVLSAASTILSPIQVKILGLVYQSQAQKTAPPK